MRRLLDSALFSKDADPWQFALWATALAATPPAFFAGRQIFLYASLPRVPPDVVERIILGHRLFYVIYAMLALALLAALLWDALFPDRDDQEIVGVLPVRARTIAASRLAAALWVGLAYSAAIAVPSAFMNVLVSLTHVGLLASPALFVGHVIGMMLAGLFVYAVLLCARGLVTMVGGGRLSRWLAGGLQLLTVILLVEVFFFLPGVLPVLTRSMLAGDAASFPAVWFAALYGRIAGGSQAPLAAQAWLAVAATLVPALAVLPIYLVPARWTARRLLETKEAERRGLLPVLADRATRLVRLSPSSRALVLFAVASLIRSRRHALILSTWIGLGVAMCAASLLSAGHRRELVGDRPETYWLALPLAITFFLVWGLRATASVPTDVDANWPFRLSLLPTRTAANATGLLWFGLGVLPVSLVMAIATLPLWPPATVAAVVLMHVVTGWFLVECVLYGWAQIPFTRAHAPGSGGLRWKWFPFLVALNLYAFRLSDVQVVAERTTTGLVWYVGAAVAASLAVHLWRQRGTAARPLRFEAQQDVAVEALNLSEALRLRAPTAPSCCASNLSGTSRSRRSTSPKR